MRVSLRVSHLPLLFCALLVPVVAYALTATLTVQIVPQTPSGAIACDIGPPYHGQIPVGAQIAGFMHCVANFDFTDASFSNKSNWLGSGNNNTCVSSTPILYNVDAGSNGQSPCSDYQMVNDTANGGTAQVLKVSNTPADIGLITTLNTVSNFGLPNPPGLHIYNGFYSEEVFRLDASYIANTSCPSGGTQACAYFDYWTIPYTCPSACGDNTNEFDFVEALAQQGPPNNSPPVAGGGSFQTFGASGAICPAVIPCSQMVSRYNTVGEIATITSSGSPNTSNCWYLNGATVNCGVATLNTADFTNAKFQIFPAEVGPQGESNSQSPQITQAVYIKSLTVWACGNYSTGPCYSSSLVTH